MQNHFILLLVVVFGLTMIAFTWRLGNSPGRPGTGDSGNGTGNGNVNVAAEAAAEAKRAVVELELELKRTRGDLKSALAAAESSTDDLEEARVAEATAVRARRAAEAHAKELMAQLAELRRTLADSRDAWTRENERAASTAELVAEERATAVVGKGRHLHRQLQEATEALVRCNRTLEHERGGASSRYQDAVGRAVQQERYLCDQRAEKMAQKLVDEGSLCDRGDSVDGDRRRRPGGRGAQPLDSAADGRARARLPAGVAELQDQVEDERARADALQTSLSDAHKQMAECTADRDECRADRKAQRASIDAAHRVIREKHEDLQQRDRELADLKSLLGSPQQRAVPLNRRSPRPLSASAVHGALGGPANVRAVERGAAAASNNLVREAGASDRRIGRYDGALASSGRGEKSEVDVYRSLMAGRRKP